MGSVQARVYKWVDEQGQIVYSQTPRPKAQEVKLPHPKTTDATLEKAVSDGKSLIKPAVTKRANGQGGRYCEQARRNVRLLRNAGPDTVFVTRDKKLVKYNDEERLKRLKIAEKAVGAYCRDRDARADATAMESEIASR